MSYFLIYFSYYNVLFLHIFEITQRKQLLLQKLAPNRQHNFINVNGLCSRDFDEETGKLHVKNYSEKMGEVFFNFFIIFSLGFLCFVLFLFCLLFFRVFHALQPSLKVQSCVTFSVFIILLQLDFIVMKNLLLFKKKSNKKNARRMNQTQPCGKEACSDNRDTAMS